MKALPSVLKSVMKERAGKPTLPLAFVVIYEYITTVDHRGQKRASMGFLSVCSYEIAAEKRGVAWAQALLCTSRSRCFILPVKDCKHNMLKVVMQRF